MVGHIWVAIKLRNPWRGLEWEGRALIDAGAARTAVPLGMAQMPGLEKIGDVEAAIAAGIERG